MTSKATRYKAEVIANEILKRAKEKGISITHLKLQKLVYYAHAWYLVFFEKPLIKESVQAWKYGPVIPELFKKYASYGRKEIPFNETSELIDGEDQKANAILCKVLDSLGTLTASQLSNLAHMEDSAWGQARKYHYDGSAKEYELTDTEIALAEGNFLRTHKIFQEEGD